MRQPIEEVYRRQL